MVDGLADVDPTMAAAVLVIDPAGGLIVRPVGIFTGAADSIAKTLGLGDNIPSSMNAFLIETEGKQILFDAGNGRNDSQLLPELNKLNITPEDIDLIFITHMHGDHIGGLIADKKAVFSNAKVYINAKELEAWMSMPEERNAQVREMIEAYGNQVITFSEADQLPCGIQPIAAYGHTEGHTLSFGQYLDSRRHYARSGFTT